MDYIITDKNNYINISDAIRSKAKTEKIYKPSEMAQAITDIEDAEIYKEQAEKATAEATEAKAEAEAEKARADKATASAETAYLEKVEAIERAEQAESFVKELIERNATEVIVPINVTTIGKSAFASMESLTSVMLHKLITEIGESAFSGSGITELYLPRISRIPMHMCNPCKSLTKIYIPNSVTKIGAWAFNGCTALTEVIVEQGFAAGEYGLNISASTLYSVETLVAILEALADRTGQTAYTLTIGATNLAKLTEEQIAIATNKNWTLA